MTTESPAADPKSVPNPPLVSPAAAPAAPDSKTQPSPPRGPDWWLMVKAFFRRGKVVASCAPSSKSMCRKLLHGIDWDRTRYLVELGGGTGPVTAAAVRLMKPHTKLLVIELDPVLCGRLKARFAHAPNVEVIQGDATLFGQYLAERGVGQVDHVLSELPLPSFPEAARNTVLETASRMLVPEGTLRQITVMPMVYYRLYCRYFRDVEFRFVPWNLPPGGVYVCRGFKGSQP